MLKGFLLPTPTDAELAAMSVIGAEVELDCSIAPDIYYIVLDAYGRSDVLKDLYGVDNSEFLAYLERRGFYIAQESSANYMQTILSLSSALNFSYLRPEPVGVSGREYYMELISDDRLLRALKQCNYRTMALETGFSYTDYLQVDVTLSDGLALNQFEGLLLASTPLDALTGGMNRRPIPYGYDAHRERVLFSFKQLAEVAGQPGPKFVFAHILSPHPPFVFDAQGQPVDPPRFYSLGDGDDFDGSWPEYRRGYAAQVQFVNQKVQEAIDAILAASPSPPVIVLQGDHGPGGSLNWDSPSRTCLYERTAILNAYHLPGQASQWLYPSISPVNTFRVILKAYFQANLDLLPDRAFFSSHRLPRQLIEITARRNSTRNCPLPTVRKH